MRLGSLNVGTVTGKGRSLEDGGNEKGWSVVCVKPGVHTNDFAPIHGRRARIHTAPAESTVDSTYCLPQALCEYGRADRESGRNR